MCGIFGYIGQRKDAAKIIFEGLKVLEYRGYDSWGITVKKDNTIAIEKHLGKIGNTKVTLPDSSIGIGHTRWATHGGVTLDNAHPHLDCTGKIAVLHNGIVENFQELKDELINKGHKFFSQTDTEVIPHLIEEYCKVNNFTTSVRLAFNRLKGLNAIVALDSNENKIIAAKNGSPLVIGFGKEELFVASDVVGILPYTREVVFLRDNELAVLGRIFELYKLPNGIKETPKVEKVTWKIEEAEKGKYKHFMLKEIYDQPKIVRNIAENYSDQINDLREVVETAKGTFFIGAGTAYHACMAGAYLFSKIAKKHVNMAPASEFNYLEDFLTGKSLIIALSQSGETIDVVEPLTRAKEKKSTIFALTNVLGSTIYRMANYKMLLGAGPEKAVASTKAYIAKLSILVMLSHAMSGSLEKAKSLLLSSALEIERLLKDENIKQYKTIAKLLSKVEHIYTIGRGVSYPTALEAALKIKEVSYIHTEGLAGGELKHGPIALIENGTYCIVFAPTDSTYDAIISNATEIKARGGIIIGVSSQNNRIFDYFIDVRDVEICSIITQVVPLQLIAYYMTLEKNLDPDKPRNLAKSVTVK